MQTVVYMGHPLSGDFEDNIRRAQLWYVFLRGLNLKGIRKLLGGWSKVVRPDRKVVDISNSGEVVMEEKAILVDPFAELPIIIAPWLTCVVPDNQYPGGRSRAISDCRGVVRIVNEMWQVGGRISDGMADEARAAKFVRDLTSWGEVPPNWSEAELFL